MRDFAFLRVDRLAAVESVHHRIDAIMNEHGYGVGGTLEGSLNLRLLIGVEPGQHVVAERPTGITTAHADTEPGELCLLYTSPSPRD